MESFSLSLMTPVVGALVDRLKPAMATLLNELQADLSEFLNLLGAYLQQSHERHSYFSTVVFPNEQLKLYEYYQPLTLVDPTDVKNKTLVNRFPSDLLEDRKDVLIVDTAGMGKSTLFKYLFLTAIEQTNYIPVLIELRRLGPDLNIKNYISKQIQLSADLVDKDVIRTLIKRGVFLLLLDGFDEIVPEYRAVVISDIQELKQWANNCKFIISSRDLPELASFSEFKRFQIQPLEPEEAYSLIRKYGAGVDTGDQLIDEIKSGQLQTVADFLGNPLLVSLLYRCYEYKQQVPLSRTVFYRQVYESMFESHDLRKPGGPLARPKKTGLDISGFEALTQTFAFITYQAGKFEYTTDEFISYVRKAIDIQPQFVGIAPHDYLSDLTVQVPLFTQDGNNYRWVHRSIQEYFCALAICHNTPLGAEKVLPIIYRSQALHGHINLLVLYSELDKKGFRRFFLKLLLTDIETYLNNSWQHLAEIAPDEVALRKSLMFDSYAILAKFRKEDEGELLNHQSSTSGFTLIFEKAKKAIAKEYPEVSTELGGGYMLANPTIVILRGRLFQFLENMPSLVLIERLSYTPKITESFDDLNNISGHLAPGFYLLTDDVSNFLNRQDYFRVINEILLRDKRWRLDEALIRATLSEIRDEELRDANYPLNF